MTLRDYEQWHQRYDDPGSDLSWRLEVVQGYIRRALDERKGPVRIVSACAGDGRDVLGVLSQRPSDVGRVSTTLIELHPEIARRAAAAAEQLGAAVEVRVRDAGKTDAYERAVPADLVLLVGIFGNINEVDLARTITCAPQLCAPGAMLVWSRGRRHGGDLNDSARAQFAAAGFTELDYATLDSASWPAAGAMLYNGPPQPLTPGRHLFTFMR